MGHWLTVEVQHAATSAYRWRDSWADSLLEAALTHGVHDWVWQTPDWGVILELEFSSEDVRDAFPGLPLVRAALDAAPDAVLGVFVIPGRGGSQGAGVSLRPRPSPLDEGACADAGSKELLAVRSLLGGGRHVESRPVQPHDGVNRAGSRELTVSTLATGGR